MLPRQHRVTRGEDYRRIVRAGTRSASPLMLTYVCVTSPEAPARFGFIITKAVGKAHVRNTVRRKLKAASLHAIRNGLSGRDVVIRAHPACASASWDQLVSAVSTAVLARGER